MNLQKKNPIYNRVLFLLCCYERTAVKHGSGTVAKLDGKLYGMISVSVPIQHRRGAFSGEGKFAHLKAFHASVVIAEFATGMAAFSFSKEIGSVTVW